MANKDIKEINWEVVSFEIIGKSGESKGYALQALTLAKENKIDEAKETLKKARESIGEAGKAHMDVIVQEAQGVKHPFNVLFMHAEDQFLTTETLLLVIGEFIELYGTINKGKK